MVNKMSYDFYANYKINSSQIFRKTKKILKSYVKLKFGFVKNKTNELNSHKNFIKDKNKTYYIGDVKKIKQISGICNDFNNFENYLKDLYLPKYSFGIWIKFKLKSPYFSKDNDEFYIIQNPIIKDYAFKVPMIRPSSWKGSLAKAFKEMLKGSKNKKEIIESYLRVFGAGSEEIKTIEDYLKENSKNFEDFKNKIIEFLLFELGLEIKIDEIKEIKDAKNEEDLFKALNEKISDKLKKIKKDNIYPIEFQTHKGRLIIYPTYFDRLSLEIINPHDRRKRAGKNPIHYEVVPKETEGILQMIYIPYDGILKKDEELKKEVEQDLEILCEAINKLADLGVGAKTKLGWGRFEMKEKYYLTEEKPKNFTKLEKLGFEYIRVKKGE